MYLLSDLSALTITLSELWILLMSSESHLWNWLLTGLNCIPLTIASRSSSKGFSSGREGAGLFYGIHICICCWIQYKEQSQAQSSDETLNFTHHNLSVLKFAWYWNTFCQRSQLLRLKTQENGSEKVVSGSKVSTPGWRYVELIKTTALQCHFDSMSVLFIFFVVEAFHLVWIPLFEWGIQTTRPRPMYLFVSWYIYIYIYWQE